MKNKAEIQSIFTGPWQRQGRPGFVSHPSSILRRSVISMIVAGGLACMAPGIVSAKSVKLISGGAQDLAAEHYSLALEKFKRAAQEDPADAEAVFFQGVVLNRLGRFTEAHDQLQKAAKMACHHPDLAFEAGWSLLGLKRWQEAIAQLEAYEQAHPGRGQTSEFLGRAYARLKNYGKALAAFTEALDRDPALKATVEYDISALERQRGNETAAEKHLEKLLVESPNSPHARVLRNQLDLMSRDISANQGPQKPWQLTLSAGGGYNSNVINLGDGFALPTDITSKGSSFGEFALNGNYGWKLTDKDQVTAGYALQSQVYDKIPSANLVDHDWYAEYAHVFSNDLVLSHRLSDEYTQIGGLDFRNQIAFRSAANYRWVDSAVVELAYSVAESDYYFPTSPAQNRNGWSHTLSLINSFAIPNSRFQAKLGYYHVFNNASGSDFDFNSDGFILGVAHPLFWKIMGELNYVHTFDHYDQPNSLSGTAGFAFPREDQTDSFGVQLTRPIWENLTAYVRFQYMHDDSNIGFFTYSQAVWSGGVSVKF